MKNDLLKELDDLVGDKKEQTENSANSAKWPDDEGAVIQHLALAAQVMGVDVEDDEEIRDFLDVVRRVVTKDKSKLRSQLKRWTASKARSAVKTTKGAIG